MFCQNCGSNNPNGAMFCENCGTRLPSAVAAPAETSAWSAPGWSGSTPSSAPSSAPGSTPAGTPGGMAYATPGGYGRPAAPADNNIIKMIIAVALVAIIAVVGVFGACSLFGGGPEKPVKYIEQAFNKRDLDILKKALPEQYTENDTTDLTQSEAILFGAYESRYGTDFKTKFKVISKSKCSDSEIADIEKRMNNEVNGEFMDVKAAYILKVEAKIEGDRDSDVDTNDVTVVKIGGKWYLAGASQAF